MAYTVWLPKQSRPAGERTSPSVSIPSGVTRVAVRLDVLPADFATPDKTITITIQTSPDGGASWRHHCGVRWVGGAPSPKTGDWRMMVDGLNGYSGHLIRAHIVQDGTIYWGLEGEIS